MRPNPNERRSPDRRPPYRHLLRIAACVLLAAGLGVAVAAATEPCDDFGACKALIEINASDGDIGFHFLMDGDDLARAAIFDPDLRRIFADHAFDALRDQGMTETFVESAEPLCWNDPEAEADEEIVTLEEFLARWTPGTYYFFGVSHGFEVSIGTTALGFDLPAAPADVDFDGGVISWLPGDDLGECADFERLAGLVASGGLPEHPVDVDVAVWEIVLEPDVEDGDPTGALVYSVRVAGDVAPTAVTVPADYLASLPEDTPVKVEVGAIGLEDNATFTEEDGFCVNEVEGCEEDEE